MSYYDPEYPNTPIDPLSYSDDSAEYQEPETQPPGLWGNLTHSFSNFITHNPLTAIVLNNPITNFVTSNDWIYRFMFVFLIIVICVIIIKIFMGRIAKKHELKSDIMLLNGTIDAQNPITISQNINANPNILVVPSRNRPGGLEFTWSVWVYIKELDSSSMFSNVFFKGVYTSNQCNNVNALTNAPGVYLHNNSETNSATIYIFMDTFTSPAVYIDGKCDTSNAIQIPYIPLNEWIHLCFGCQDRNMDVYVNGIITSSIRLIGIPKQNNGDIYVAQNKGFYGKISSLRYISRKLSGADVLGIYKKGPNTKEIAPKKSTTNFNDFLSFSWYTK